VAVATLVGVPATATGAGIGVRHVQKEGLTVESAAGLMLLVAGTALLGYAVVVFWRATRGWRRLWLVPASVLSLLVMWPVAVAVMLTNAPSTPLGSATPADRGLSYSSVGFHTGDGIRLSAWLLPSRNGATVILLHGAGENRTATLPQAAVLARHGFGLLMVDARGHGSSEGSGMDAGWYGDADVTAAVTFLLDRRGVDPDRIGVLGLSMGGEEAIGAAAADPRIRAVVAEGATARTAADKARWLPGGVAGEVQRGLDWTTFGIAGLLTDAPRPAPLYDAIVRSSGTPFLLISAGKVADERRAADVLRAASPERVQVWTVPGAGHTHGVQARPHEWETRVVAFLDRALDVRTS
jgi:pimeloyl-ACP methyl ester carboxylesterase